jgi:hypothetical protein
MRQLLIVLLVLICVTTVSQAETTSSIKSLTEWENVAVLGYKFIIVPEDVGRITTSVQTLQLKSNKILEVPALGYTHQVTYGLVISSQFDQVGGAKDSHIDIGVLGETSGDIKLSGLTWQYNYYTLYDFKGNYEAEFSFLAAKGWHLRQINPDLMFKVSGGYNHEQLRVIINNTAIISNDRDLFYKAGLLWEDTSKFYGINYKSTLNIADGFGRIDWKEDAINLFVGVKF